MGWNRRHCYGARWSALDSPEARSLVSLMSLTILIVASLNGRCCEFCPPRGLCVSPFQHEILRRPATPPPS